MLGLTLIITLINTIIHTNIAGKIHFLFLEDKKFLNAHIWSNYFNNITNTNNNPNIKYQIYIICHSSDKFIAPLYLQYKLISEVKSTLSALSSGMRTISLMNQLLSESLSSQSVIPKDDIFIILNSESIPIKPLEYIFSYFYPRPSNIIVSSTITNHDKGNHNNISSSFCINPTDEWEINDNNNYKRAVKHHVWMILNRNDAIKVTTKFKDSFLLKSLGYNMIATMTNNHDKKSTSKLEEYWFYMSVFGDFDLNDKNTWNSLQPVLSIEQGNCHTFIYNENIKSSIDNDDILYKTESPFYKNITSLTNVSSISNSKTINYNLLKSIKELKNFFFIRKFHSESPSYYVYKKSDDIKNEKDQRMSYLEALLRLGVVNSNKTIDDYYNSNSSKVNIYSSIMNNNNSIHHSSKKENHHSNHSSSMKSLRFKRGKGDNKGLKVLMVSIDDRPIKLALNQKPDDYVSMVAVLQSDYAKHNGYDFISFQTDHGMLVKALKERYKELNISDKSFEEFKYGYASYHPGLKYFRASSWSKLPPLWYLNREYGRNYDYIWFVDSDATPNPVNRNRSLSDSLQYWKSNNNKLIYKGVKDPYNATFIFMSNFPWREDLPCAGTFFFKTGKNADVILREWWDYNIPQKNQADFMEQDALWYMLDSGPEYQFNMNLSVVTLLSESQFPSAWFGVNDLWLAHIPNYESNRNCYFRTMLRTINRYNTDAFKAAIEHILKHSRVVANILDLAEEMEQLHIKPYRSKYPTVRTGRADDNWHGVNNWKSRPPQPLIGTLFNGFVLGFSGQRELFLVTNNTKRPFPNFETFVKMGYDLDMVLKYRVNKDSQWYIPTGDKLPTLV